MIHMDLRQKLRYKAEYYRRLSRIAQSKGHKEAGEYYWGMKDGLQIAAKMIEGVAWAHEE